MGINKEHLIQILYSNYNAGIDYYTIDELMFLFENNCLAYNNEAISNVDEFYIYIDKIHSKEINTFDIEGGGIRHLALKLIGLNHYNKIYKKVNIENWFQGYKPDLLFKNDNETLIVECGDTNPTKLIEYFVRKEINKVIIISYPNNKEFSIYQHIFSRGPEMDDYLTIKNKIVLSKVKNIIKNR